MKISFLIPSKDGGEGFEELVKSIKSNIRYATSKGHHFSYEIVILINGNPVKPLRYIESSIDLKNSTRLIKVDFLGKVKSINFYIKQTVFDFIAIFDDDVVFGEKLLSAALDELITKPHLSIIAFQTRVLPYVGNNPLKRVLYDIINIRSLKKLYKGIDPFLFGRFIVSRTNVIDIPDHIINEDLYLSVLYEGNYLIRPEEVFYVGECSLFRHIKRVLRIEAGRKQIHEIFGQKYDYFNQKIKREIDLNKLKNCNFYYKTCYYCYKVLRFFTNFIVPILFRHNTSYW